jgi:death-on-curing protein
VTSEPRWVTKEAAPAFHDILISQHGGRPGILDEGLLAAAMEAPRNHFAYEQAPILRLAAIYAHGLTKNHPFVDGNKRVALTVAGVFLELNGFRLEATERDAVSAMNALSAGDLGRDGLESWLLASSSKTR